MEQLTALLTNFIDLSAEASPWLLLGLLIAGLMKSWVPSKILSKHLGKGKLAIVKAALIGAPLPLCSCGVIPVATELRRSGASAEATASFLVATPETGVDSVSVSYALLGPVLAIYRPFAAIMSAIITGLLVSTIKEQESNAPRQQSTASASPCCATSSKAKVAKAEMSSCCSSNTQPPAVIPPTASKSCCASKPAASSITHLKSANSCGSTQAAATIKAASTCCSSTTANTKNIAEVVASPISLYQKTKTGIYYALTRLIDDIILWLIIGLVFAAIVRTFMPADFLLSYGSGLPAMLLMIAISIPMYICATASTPIAAGFIMAGLSPGTALVFMMAGPATNISTLGVIKKEMGMAVLTRYLMGVALCAIGFASLLDFALNVYQIDIGQQMQHAHEILPHWLGLACALLLALLAIKPLRRLVL